LKNKIRIGLITEGFIDWAGGIEFLKYVLLGLIRNQDYELQLLIPDRNTKSLKKKNKIKIFLNFFFKNKFALTSYPDVNETSKFLSKYLKVDKYKIYKNQRELVSIINKDMDIVLPVYNPFRQELKVPSIGYVYDIQHKSFPDFFQKSELKKRDSHFNSHVKKSENIIVNAYSVKNDMAKYYQRDHNIHVIPFTPIFDKEIIEIVPDFDKIKLKYNIDDKPYFIICNQFWKHKGHLVAIKALLITLRKYNYDCNLIFTGIFSPETNLNCKLMQDFIVENNLSDHIKFVGFIEKPDQLSLILNSCAIIQPTQFEGGPGGFIVFEALAYHQRCIVSDIEVNKEIESEPLITFFKVNNENDLAVKMIDHLNSTIVKSTFEQLSNDFEYRKRKLEEFWSILINAALKK
jgi:glycosyltransferase involved in cell wall biosynthesis